MSTANSSKAGQGNFFEDFSIGQVLHHATPRTITAGDASLYTALTGSRFILSSSQQAAQSIGHDAALVDDLLLFHIAFGKTVDDVSLNAVANLGYADIRFITPVYIGDTISVSSSVIGLRENRNGKSGIVYVESVARNQHDQTVLRWNRWVMVHKRDAQHPTVPSSVPELPEQVALQHLQVPEQLDYSQLSLELSGSAYTFDDYVEGEMIDHIVGMTIDDSDHTLATKLYQNNARVHFDQVHMQNSQFKQRLIYGGHIISICRALSFNGLANATNILAINGGSHLAPTFAGDTIYALSQVVEKIDLPGRTDVAALRLNTWGLKNIAAEAVPEIFNKETKKYHENVVLALDYTVLIPR